MGKEAFFTICSANYLSRALALLDSIKVSKRASIYLVLCEKPSFARRIVLPKPYRLMTLHDLDYPPFIAMAFKYNIVEFNTSIKPLAFARLLHEYERVVYLDPDMVFHDDPDIVWDQFGDEHTALLTPHVSRPVPDDGLFPSLERIHLTGQFNFGFLGLRNHPQVRSFLEWWKDKLFTRCVNDGSNGIFVDQSWGALIASFVDSPKVVRHSGWNMAYWNIGHRILQHREGRYLTDDGPLLFFHFSGFIPDDPNRLSRFTQRGSPIAPGSALARLTEDYVAKLDAATHRVAPFAPPHYSFDSFDDGTRIADHQRLAFARLHPEIQKHWNNPFLTSELINSIII